MLVLKSTLLSMVAAAAAFAPLPPVGRKAKAKAKDDRPHQTALFGVNDDMSAEEREIAMEKATKAMTAFTNKYLQNTGTTLCSDKSVPAVVIKGLAEHKVNLGAPLCPCRFYEDKEAEGKSTMMFSREPKEPQLIVIWSCICLLSSYSERWILELPLRANAGTARM